MELINNGTVYKIAYVGSVGSMSRVITISVVYEETQASAAGL
jgi:purine-nucleoside phosphorylase